MTDSIYSVMGVYAVTVIGAAWVIRWLIGMLERRDAVIASKDETILKMLPVLTDANRSMAEVAQVSNELLRAEAAVRARDAQ